MAVKVFYMCLTLLLLLGTQLATSKSVDENFKGTLSISKRDANEQSKDDAEAATVLPIQDEAKEVTPLQVATTVEPSKTRRQSDETTTVESTTALAEEEAETTLTPDSESTPAPVKPLGSSGREDKVDEKAIEQQQQQPDSSYLPPLEGPPHNAIGHGGEPASNLLPPLPYEYLLLSPPPHNEFILPPPPQAPFAPWSIYAQPEPPYPYDYPHPSGPAFSEANLASASASASSGPNGGTVSVSTSPSGAQQSFGAPSNGVYQSSSSHSGPGAQQSASAYAGAAPGGGVYQSSSSQSGPGVAKPGPGVQVATGPSFVSMRGSFPADDDESVAIQVDGPARSGSPVVYGQSNQGVGISGPEYSASAGYGPYGGSIPSYGPSPYGNAAPSFAGPQDFQAYIQQYFAALQAQQLEFQRQLQAQIQAQQQAIWEQSNRVDGNFGAAPGGAQSAYASANYGPAGGYQSAQVNPASPGIFSRFGESIPPPSGNSYGVFSSSSSSSYTGPDGKQVNRKVASVGVNDNGKVSVKTVHDP